MRHFIALAAAAAALLMPAAGVAASTASPGTTATASAAYDAYVACSRTRTAAPASSCFAGDAVGAFFRSNLADVTYEVCVTFPTGKELCANDQAATRGTLYVNNITTTIPGRHTVTWTVNGVEIREQFVLEREGPPPTQKRTCGLLPGDGAYSYIETRGIGCQAGKRIAHRARKKFCSARNDCLIQPPTPITKVYAGNVRYRGWSCRVKDGWELLVVRCRKGEMSFVQKSGA
ncbi:MAG TPA: hypothetical protein VFY48_02795 [Solirubrobacterales bacterium]|nr:hypothetical protein [Solirubrobacterales bacterium]